MNIKQARDQAVAKTMQSIRGIEKDMGVNYPALKQIRTELISLTADQNLFPAEDFPLDPTGGDVIYRLSEDNDHRFALYGSVGSEGKSAFNPCCRVPAMASSSSDALGKRPSANIHA
mgnify:CR=1 FL=1